MTHKFCQKILRCAQDDSFKRLLLRYRTADFCFVSDKGLPCDGGLGPLCTARAAGAVPLLRGKGTKTRRAAPLTPYGHMARGLRIRLLMPLNTAKHKEAFSPRSYLAVRLAVAAEKCAFHTKRVLFFALYAVQRLRHA